MSLLGEFIRTPTTIGAVAASGRALSQAATAPVPVGTDVVVVELGPGTGAMTGAIERRLAGRGRQLAIEVNARLALPLSTRHPAVEVVQADAADLQTVLTDRGITHADVVVSGLPWAAFRPRQQELLLDAVVSGLASDGVFTTFAYLHGLWTPAARRFRRQLEARFEEVLLSRTVWRNLPPALVYYARRPTEVGQARFARGVTQVVAAAARGRWVTAGAALRHHGTTSSRLT
ncbi:class I SAM-dependent methyltransferase [Modestobacter sp. VKM Ac-2985]|uniref:class I SAM-dependent methyltransferase n=1 Tax=Modestobacter sp. VKM Ac-2985 TaxID=3004139 RepID=UPI0022AB6204|nr:hypothetical protein [Modestobacter sp. VKM Ac-2985]MCZ2839622.1 hypothetical protein [Modestobacter sp. VKM Ac-2985]